VCNPMSLKVHKSEIIFASCKLDQRLIKVTDLKFL